MHEVKNENAIFFYPNNRMIMRLGMILIFTSNRVIQFQTGKKFIKDTQSST